LKRRLTYVSSSSTYTRFPCTTDSRKLAEIAPLYEIHYETIAPVQYVDVEKPDKYVDVEKCV